MLQSKPDDLIAPISELCKDDVGVAGGKGANLGELTRVGVPIVPGFVVTAPAYFRFLVAANLRPEVERLLAGLNVDDRDALEATAKQVRRLLSAAPVPQDIAAGIVAAYVELGEGPVAVRSSATAEDLAQASFAGQQETYLNIEGRSDVVRAVQDCWASLFEARAIHYRAGAGFAHLDVGIAVVVQRMVQSERSGVMFTLHPVTNDATQILIEAVFGLGEAIVSGQVTPDMYAVDKATNAVIDAQISPQEQEFVRAPEPTGDGHNHWVPIDWSRRTQQKLSDDEIAQLASLGERLESHFGCPQDIEWAYEGGSFYILQSRAITTAAP